MRSPDSKTRARTELVDLIKTQLNTLENKTFGCVTEAGLWEYEDRRDRICQLYAELIDREAAGYLAAARSKSRNDHLSDPRVVCCSTVGGSKVLNRLHKV